MLTGEKFTAICMEMFGKNWRKSIAAHLNISPARVYQLANVVTLPEKSAAKVLDLHQTWKGGTLTVNGMVVTVKSDEDGFSDDEILGRVNKRFEIMNQMVAGMINQKVRSLIVYGAPGIGKTYDIERQLKQAFHKDQLEYTIIKGTCSGPGLYQALYNARKGGVVVLDDCDSIFNDEQTFNILKSALDSSDVRTIAWRKLSSWLYDVREDGDVGVKNDRFPNVFDFEGGIVFITNIDFKEKVTKEMKMSAHFQALLSRSLYLDLTLTSARSRVLRIKDVFMNSMSKIEKLNVNEAKEILDYVLDNSERLYELSLRTVKHICQLYQIGSNWRDVVEMTKMKSPKV